MVRHLTKDQSKSRTVAQMSVTLRKETEAIPAEFPSVSYPAGVWNLENDAQKQKVQMLSGVIWQRIEAYIRTRYTERQVEWIVDATEGAEWVLPLGPLVSQTAEKWSDGAWSSISLSNGPLGLVFTSDGTFKITAQIGAGTPPEAITEAHRRLSVYLAGDPEMAGVSSYSVNIGGAIQEQFTRSAAHNARAMQNSGAADLLRPYRRQKT